MHILKTLTTKHQTLRQQAALQDDKLQKKKDRIIERLSTEAFREEFLSYLSIERVNIVEHKLELRVDHIARVGNLDERFSVGLAFASHPKLRNLPLDEKNSSLSIKVFPSTVSSESSFVHKFFERPLSIEDTIIGRRYHRYKYVQWEWQCQWFARRHQVVFLELLMTNVLTEYFKADLDDLSLLLAHESQLVRELKHYYEAHPLSRRADQR